MGNLHKILPPKIPKFVHFAQEEILQKCLTNFVLCGKMYIEGKGKSQKPFEKIFKKFKKKLDKPRKVWYNSYRR